MIKASHNKFARSIFNPFIERLLKKNFSNFYLLNKSSATESSLPLIVTPNHFSWWDGFFIDYINREVLKRKIYLMMLEEQLKRYWFFKHVGAFSINQSNPKSIINSVQYFKEIMHELRSMIVFYPQGLIEPYDKRPLCIKKGLQLFVKNIPGNFNVQIISFKVQYYNKKNPAIICRFGSVIEAREILENFDIYINLFHDNLNLLDNESVTENKFIQDLFL